MFLLSTFCYDYTKSEVSVPCNHIQNKLMNMYIWKWVCKWVCMYVYVYMSVCMCMSEYMCRYITESPRWITHQKALKYILCHVSWYKYNYIAKHEPILFSSEFWNFSQIYVFHEWVLSWLSNELKGHSHYILLWHGRVDLWSPEYTCDHDEHSGQSWHLVVVLLSVFLEPAWSCFWTSRFPQRNILWVI